MAVKKKPKFLRIGYTQYSKLGLRRMKKQKYRKGKGGENKMRLKMKGHLRNVSIGFRSEKKTRDLIMGLKPVLIYGAKDIEKLKKDEIGVVAKIGSKKKIEIADYAIKNNIRLSNLNSKKFMEKIEEERKKAKEEKKSREEKKKIRDKKAKDAEKKTEEKKETEKKDLETSIQNAKDKTPEAVENEPEK